MAGLINKPLPMMSLPDLIDVFHSQRRIMKHARTETVRAHATAVMQAVEREITIRAPKAIPQ